MVDRPTMKHDIRLYGRWRMITSCLSEMMALVLKTLQIAEELMFIFFYSKK